MRLTEALTWEATGNDTPGIFPDVKVIGRTSKNKRRYTNEALDDIARLAEGMAVYVNHSANPKAGRGLLERFGTLQNVKRTEGQVRASLPYLESASEVVTRLKEDVSRKLNCFGLSVDCDGTWFRDKDDTQVITKVTKLYSVDLVSGPGTTLNLKEQNMEPEVPAVDPAVEALRAGIMTILDGGGTVDEIKTKLIAFINPEESEEEPKETVKEQTQIAKLQEQIDALKAAKPKKFITPAAPEKAQVRFTEQTLSGPPVRTANQSEDEHKNAMRKWLNSK